jgi:hypothetical protein
LKPASAPPRSYGNRFQLAEGKSPLRSACHCTHKATYFLFPAAQLPSCLSPAATAPPFFFLLPRASYLQENSLTCRALTR